MKSRAISSAGGPVTSGGYAQACEVSGVSRWLFVSGQIPLDSEGATPVAFEDQARLVWANVEAQLEAAGMNLDSIVKHTTFLADRRYRDENSRVRQQILGDRTPALTVIIADIYDEAWLLEVEVVAAA